MDPSLLLQHYGPRFFPGVVLGCALFENDVTFIMAGVYVATLRHHAPGVFLPPGTHLPSLSVAVLAGVCGALGHDTFWYAIGRHRSAWLKRTKAWRSVGPQIEEWAARFGALELLLCRFIPGTRNASQLFWGVQRLPLWRFYSFEGIGLIVWGTMLTWFGYKFSQQAEAWIGRVHHRHLARYLLLILLLVGIGYAALRVFARHEIVKHGKPPPDPRAD